MGDTQSKDAQNVGGGTTHQGTPSPKKYQEREITPEIAFYLPEHAKNPRVLKCIIIGGGQRGQAYAWYSQDFPHLVKIVAVADPRTHVRALFGRRHNVPEDMLFSDWTELVKKEKFADFVCICTPDKLHKDPAIAFAEKKYHILLEKPMATTKEDCIAVTKAVKDNDVMLAVCHVLRYHPPNKKIKELIDSGAVGDVVNIQHLEPVGFWHFAHSYVRGNWRNTAESSFSLLAKSCHDIDLISYWLSGNGGNNDSNQSGKNHCTAVSSFGSLNHFKKQNKPEGAADLCLDCKVEESCPYSAVKIYLDRGKSGLWGWPCSVVCDVEDVAVLTDSLRHGPYGRCVYDCDNDVCDNQVVNMMYSGGQTVSFSMVAFTESICARKTKVFGTKGEITYSGGNRVEHFDFLTNKRETYDCSSGLAHMTHMRGHGGADFFVMDSFVKAIMFNDPSYIQSGPDETLQSHLLVFAAEESRLSGKAQHPKSDGSWF